MIYSLTINQKLLHQFEIRFGRCFDYRHSVLMAFFHSFFHSTHSAVLRGTMVDKYGAHWWFISYALIHRSLPYFRLRHHLTLTKLIDPLITHSFLRRKKVWQIEEPPSPDKAPLPPTPTLQKEKKPRGRVKLYFAPGKNFADFFYRPVSLPAPSSHSSHSSEANHPSDDISWLDDMFGDESTGSTTHPTPMNTTNSDLSPRGFSSNNQTKNKTNRDEGMVGLPSST